MPSDELSTSGPLKALSSGCSISKENIQSFSFYALFGVKRPEGKQSSSPQWDETDMRRRYRRFSLLFHPDKDGSPEARKAFEYTKLALETLLDPALRQVYDQQLDAAASSVGGRGLSTVESEAVAASKRAADAARDILEAKDASERATRDLLRRQTAERELSAKKMVEELTHSADAPFKELEAALVYEWNIDEELLLQKEEEVCRLLHRLSQLHDAETSGSSGGYQQEFLGEAEQVQKKRKL